MKRSGQCPKCDSNDIIADAKAGHRHLRSLLVEVAWLMLRHNPAFARVYEKALRGSKTRKKIEAVATARQLLVTCWAMLCDETDWREPAPGRAQAAT